MAGVEAMVSSDDTLSTLVMIAFSVFAISIIGFLNFIIGSGLLKSLLNMFLGTKINFFKFKKWISNIPGNPTSLDHLVTVILGPYPEMNDFNAILTGVPLNGPILMQGIPPKCRYYSFQLFIPMIKVNSSKQCIRDIEIELDQNGKFNILISKACDIPYWWKFPFNNNSQIKNWIEIPMDENGKFPLKCILMYRCYCPEIGVGIKAPKLWYNCSHIIDSNQLVKKSNEKSLNPIQNDTSSSSSSCSSSVALFEQHMNAALMQAGKCEELSDENRVMGMFPAQLGQGASYHRLKEVIIFNLFLLIIFGSLIPAAPLEPFATMNFHMLVLEYFQLKFKWQLYDPYGDVWKWHKLFPSIHLLLPFAGLWGYILYKLSFKFIAKLNKNRILKQQSIKNDKFIPNKSVVLPESILGHPNHMYYTIYYEASNKIDVKIQGFKKYLMKPSSSSSLSSSSSTTQKATKMNEHSTSQAKYGFTYTSVTCYGWSSLPLANGQFRYDETLISDHDKVDMKSDEEEEDDETYTVYLTTKPTYKPGINEIDVSQEPSGLCFVRLIYPESDQVVQHCTPKVQPVPRGQR